MHTVYEAKKLECRQTAHSRWTGNSAHFVFPSCSANACGHWITTETAARKSLTIIQEQDYVVHSLITDSEHEAFKARVVKEIVEGWKPADKNWTDIKNRTVWLTRPLQPDEQIGRCGLIFDPIIECEVR